MINRKEGSEGELIDKSLNKGDEVGQRELSKQHKKERLTKLLNDKMTKWKGKLSASF